MTNVHRGVLLFRRCRVVPLSCRFHTAVRSNKLLDLTCLPILQKSTLDINLDRVRILPGATFDVCLFRYGLQRGPCKRRSKQPASPVPIPKDCYISLGSIKMSTYDQSS
jgi:hypothetical protein